MGTRRLFSIIFLISILTTIATGCVQDSDEPPIPGNRGLLEFDNATADAITIRWERAIDANTKQSFLDYKVVQSTSPNLVTLPQCERGKAVPRIVDDPDSDEPLLIIWNKDLTSIDATGLNDGTRYYFNVIVRDRAWQQAVYQMGSGVTADITPPVPGYRGLVALSDEEIETDGTISLTVNWAKASDNHADGSAVLEYRVVRSTTANITCVQPTPTSGACLEGTPYNAETNDETPAAEREWVVDTDSRRITGLPRTTEPYYFNVIVKDRTQNKAIYNITSQAPEPGGNGMLTVSDETSTGLTLNWTKAYDGENTPDTLSYRVVRTSVDENGSNIDTVEEAEANDETPAGDQVWHPDIDLLRLTGLTSEGTYWLNVLVKDITDFKTVYKPTTNAPIPIGSLSISNLQPTSLTISWPAAIDNGTPQGDLRYIVVSSLSNNLSTVVEAELNGTEETAWQAATTAIIADLDQTLDYYFNVIITDPSGHKAVYSRSVLSSAAARSPSAVAAAVTRSSTALSAVAVSGPDSDGGFETSATLVSPPTFLTAQQDGPKAWLDAQSLVFPDMTSASTLLSWPDKSENNNHAVQSSEDQAPLVGPGQQINGIPAVGFDPLRNTHLTVPFNGVLDLNTPSQTLTVFIVADPRGDERFPPQAAIWTLSGDTGESSGLYLRVADGLTEISLEAPDEVLASTDAPATPFVAAVILGRDARGDAFGELTINGVTERGPVYTNDYPEAIDRLVIGTGSITEETDVARPPIDAFDGTLGELIVFDRLLSPDQHDQVTSYLKEKWQIQ